MDRVSIIGHFKKALQTNEMVVNDIIEKYTAFDKITPYQFNNYNLDYIQFTLNLGIFNKDLFSLFDSIVSSRYVPYAVVTSNSKILYKIHVGFKVNLELLDFEINEAILLKVNCEIDGLRPLHDKYAAYNNVAFAISDNQLYVTMDVNIGHRNVDKTKFIERVFSAFSIKLTPHSEKDNKIVSVYIIPRQCVDQYIFADIAMNDRLTSFIISINEFIKPSKISATIYCHIAGGTNTASLVLKQTKRPNEHGMDEAGEWYVKVRVKVNETADIVMIQNIIGRIFSIYNDRYDDMVSEYRKYIPTWSPQSCLVSPKKKLAGAKGLRAVAPEVFYPTYSRKCANQPEIINSISDATGSQTMTFPIHGEVINDIPVKPRIYTCKEKSHPYIGLRRNELGNKNIFEALPCCFKRDQIDKQGSLYRKYYFGEKETTTARQLQDTESYKRRILLPGETESLPANITKLFSILESDPTVTYVRNGITRSKLSSIEAILYGRGQVAYKKMRLTTIVNKVTAQWKKLDSEQYAMSAKQELYEMDIQDIRNEIQTQDLRPSKFVHALETCMDCNIFIFTSSNDNIEGSLLVPNHLVFYSKFNPNRETFFLYELYDSSEDYPAVELITKFKGSTSFFPGDDIVKKIFHVFNRQTKTSISNITIPRFPRLNVIGQIIDHNGKCRVINVNINDVIMTIITDPLPPFAAVQLVKIYRISNGKEMERLG
jgi:protein associated with RNAse G/E